MTVTDYVVSEFLEAGIPLAKTILKGGAEATGKGLLKSGSVATNTIKGTASGLAKAASPAKFVSPRMAQAKGLGAGQSIMGA